MGLDGGALAPRNEKSAWDGVIVSPVVHDARRDVLHVFVELVRWLVLHVVIRSSWRRRNFHWAAHGRCSIVFCLSLLCLWLADEDAVDEKNTDIP